MFFFHIHIWFILHMSLYDFKNNCSKTYYTHTHSINKTAGIKQDILSAPLRPNYCMSEMNALMRDTKGKLKNITLTAALSPGHPVPCCSTHTRPCNSNPPTVCVCHSEVSHSASTLL